AVDGLHAAFGQAQNRGREVEIVTGLQVGGDVLHALIEQVGQRGHEGGGSGCRGLHGSVVVVATGCTSDSRNSVSAASEEPPASTLSIFLAPFTVSRSVKRSRIRLRTLVGSLSRMASTRSFKLVGVDAAILTIASRLLILRKERSLTQQQLADELGITKSAISKFESGRSKPSPAVLTKLGQLLGSSVDWLLTGFGARIEFKPTLAGPENADHQKNLS
nr:hypothetical protein [Tanacetum cinerariifolium]